MAPRQRLPVPLPTRRLAALLGGIAILSALLPVPVVVPALLCAGLAGAFVTDWLLGRRLAPELTRSEPPTLALRSPIAFEATMTGLDGAGRVRLRQPFPPDLAVEPSETASASLAGTLTGRHRGAHELPPVTLRVTGPLRLASLESRHGESLPVTVIPNLPLARRLEAARRRGRTSDEGRIRARLGLGTEFETIRDYSPDDDIRQVNWVATARTGRPMSNQYRVDENREVMLVVDAGRLMASPIGDVTRLDVSLDAMAVLAVAAEESGDRVGAVAFDARVSRHVRPARRNADAVVRALYDLEPVPVESDYERAFFVVGRQKRSLVVLFTDLLDEGATRTIVDALPIMCRRHAVLVAGVTDPDITAGASTPPRDMRDVMRTIVATDVLSGRDRTLAVLRSLGADVVEAGPESLGPACVAAYLRLKQRARL